MQGSEALETDNSPLTQTSTRYSLLINHFLLFSTHYSLLTILTSHYSRGQMVGEGRSVEASGETYEGQFNGHRKLLAPAWGASYGQVKTGKQVIDVRVPPCYSYSSALP